MRINPPGAKSTIPQSSARTKTAMILVRRCTLHAKLGDCLIQPDCLLLMAEYSVSSDIFVIPLGLLQSKVTGPEAQHDARVR